MVSPELLRRYPFFAGLSHEQLVTIAKLAEDETVEAGHYFLREGDDLRHIYLVVEGAVAIVIEVPDQEIEQKLSGQLTGDLVMKDVVISVVGPGEVFAWSGMVPPHKAVAGSKATTECRVIALDTEELARRFEEDCEFGYVMMQKIAQVIAGRLRDMRIESLSWILT